MTSTAEVYLWGSRIAVIHKDDTPYVSFEYDRRFLNSGIEVSPLKMPLSDRVYVFKELPLSSFHGVPGLLSDSLPDRFGNAVIDSWLARNGRTADSFSVIERLCYTGTRGMGALEYVPVEGPEIKEKEKIDVSELVKLASDVLNKRKTVHANAENDIGLKQLLALGTSAGGARAKAIIAWNEDTKDVCSGQIAAGDGYGYWLIKFDGVSGNGDHGVQDVLKYTLIEYAYYLMARASGIEMEESRIFEEGGRHHFMTKRFDRTESGDKLHMQTLGALAHIDYNAPGLCGYEQAQIYMRRLGLSQMEIEQFYRRMAFNVLAVNQDDHVKNISFLMDRRGRWSLSPAYDITYAKDEENRWLSAHQMTVNGKSTDISEDDIIEAGKNMDISAARCRHILEEVRAVVDKWEIYAKEAGLDERTTKYIAGQLGKSYG